MPLLTELEVLFGLAGYKDAAPTALRRTPTAYFASLSQKWFRPFSMFARLVA